MMPTETVGNPGLESEYLASRILHGNIQNPSYLNLRMNLAGLSFIDAAQDLTDVLSEIRKMVVTTFGLVEKPIVKQYYYGKGDELRVLIDKALEEVSKLVVMYGEAVPEKHFSIAESMAQDLDESPSSYEDIGERINRFQIDQDHLMSLDQTLQELRRMQGVLEAILRVNQEDNAKLSSKELTPKVSTDYRIYLNDLMQNMEVATDNAIVAMIVAKGIDAIQSTLPKDDLDPYIADVCNNVIKTLTNPKDFYSMCNKDEVVSSAVGQMFGHCYPEFFNKFLDIYMDKYDTMTQQETMDFRKCFGLDADDSELTSLCSQYVKLGFAQQ